LKAPDLRAFLNSIERIAPSKWAESWDNTGLQVDSLGREISKVFVSLDATLRSVKAASGHGAQLLLTHHPLIFRPLSVFELRSYPAGVIAEAVKRELAVVAAHTNLDVARGGINDILAELVEIENVEVLEESEAFEGIGLGRIGDLSEPLMLSRLTAKLERLFGPIRLVDGDSGDRRVRRVAVVGGAGGGLAGAAVGKGADVLITGDVGHHQAVEARSMGIALLDAGHYGTEKTAFTIFGERLRDMLASEGWDVAVEIDREERNPIREV